MDWIKKEKKNRKKEKWMDNWHKRTNPMNIHIKTSSEVIEAYYFSDNIINNLIRSYPSDNVLFDGGMMEGAKTLLTNITLWYLYAYNAPLEEGLRFKFNKPSFETLASFMELFVRTEYEYDFDKGEDFDKSHVVPVSLQAALSEIALYPLLRDKGDKLTVHPLYSESHSDVIKALPDVHPYIYKSLTAFALQNKGYRTELICICVAALRKAHYVIVVPKEYF